MKIKLHSLISVEDWECEDVWTEKAEETKAVDCILYCVTGFLSVKMKKATRCPACRSAFSIDKNTSAEAALTNVKNRGGLIHPNKNLFQLLKKAEQFFVENKSHQTVYWDTIDSVLDTCTITFPCAEHKEETVAQLLHYYFSMRMRQHCQHITMSMNKQAQEKKKSAKQRSS